MNATKIIYDLNIYRLEELNAEGEYEYAGPWRVHAYRLYDTPSGGTGHFAVLDPISFTDEEAEALGLGSGDFDADDSWYDLDWLLSRYKEVIPQRLLDIFSSLPEYEEENK